jgi:hypothetical protein
MSKAEAIALSWRRRVSQLNDDVQAVTNATLVAQFNYARDLTCEVPDVIARATSVFESIAQDVSIALGEDSIFLSDSYARLQSLLDDVARRPKNDSGRAWRLEAAQGFAHVIQTRLSLAGLRPSKTAVEHQIWDLLLSTLHGAILDPSPTSFAFEAVVVMFEWLAALLPTPFDKLADVLLKVREVTNLHADGLEKADQVMNYLAGYSAGLAVWLETARSFVGMMAECPAHIDAR